MTHSLKYIGITRDALLEAAKYDPPSAEIVTALVEAVGEDHLDAVYFEREIEDLRDEIERLQDQLDELKTNQETESND